MSTIGHLRLTVLPLVALGLCGCQGGLHQRGDQQFTLHSSYAWPIKGDTLWPEGEGSAENAAATIGYGYFVSDRLALRSDLTPYRLFQHRDGDVAATELQVGLRYYLCDFEVCTVPIGVYTEAFGGLVHSSKRVPADGAHTNFTQDLGVGLEARLSDQFSLLTGYRYRHMSHGHVFAGEPNPGQNDGVVYAGMAITW